MAGSIVAGSATGAQPLMGQRIDAGLECHCRRHMGNPLVNKYVEVEWRKDDHVRERRHTRERVGRLCCNNTCFHRRLHLEWHDRLRHLEDVPCKSMPPPAEPAVENLDVKGNGKGRGKRAPVTRRPISNTVVIAKTGDLYHRDGCSYLTVGDSARTHKSHERCTICYRDA